MKAFAYQIRETRFKGKKSYEISLRTRDQKKFTVRIVPAFDNFVKWRNVIDFLTNMGGGEKGLYLENLHPHQRYPGKGILDADYEPIPCLSPEEEAKQLRLPI